ncbi:Base methyltransferase of 25S RNA 6 [Hyphodiscus hymeniophilus]|uniref:Base methyltransferase of 25S RNA 6 n=1 Tax=Hyphodiscus hymeniophilus TaxID=353542 RepID=A0A9P6VE66_9HELO|nr:Base methyltransferase of 25S RNA 6 [Hyphodiscus hymeniophilus]
MVESALAPPLCTIDLIMNEISLELGTYLTVGVHFVAILHFAQVYGYEEERPDNNLSRKILPGHNLKMGKNGKFGKDYGKVVGKDSKSRPGWKGPGFVKKADPPRPKPPTAETSDTAAVQLLPLDLQQLLLNVFRDSFSDVLTSDTLQSLLQSVKAALYERDFTRAFGKEDNLEAYSARWSPGRALCYTAILVDLRKHLAKITLQGNADSPNSLTGTLRVASFGGGAAEVVAFGGLIRHLQGTISKDDPEVASDIVEGLSSLSVSDRGTKIDLHLLDTAAWGNVVDKLYRGLISPPPLSKYASTSAKESNISLISDGSMSMTYHLKDVLALNSNLLSDLLGQQPMLLTLLFTLNELYTASIAKTTEFLLNLTLASKPGTLLLVVDSPGSYSETIVGSEAKKYPMKWLLDHTLLETDKSRGDETDASWQKVISEDSQWFRLPEGLRYPISLENMRYQIHLYRRV